MNPSAPCDGSRLEVARPQLTTADRHCASDVVSPGEMWRGCQQAYLEVSRYVAWRGVAKTAAVKRKNRYAQTADAFPLLLSYFQGLAALSEQGGTGGPRLS